ncbi:hypothetical protein GQX73_g3099 [Xylaria multiplex]|uniref:Uncharacterized protein n=1 Tax=Xylaria multiplex TaxID=323545 RepID=A0A7C8MVF2_9PEZI|nr:hypothetical protein GQX73_g3099 [Xylaria multiplex]
MLQWIINERGYANIVPNEAAREAEASDDSSSDKPSQSPGVYGLVYRLHPDDERMLDVYEGVGFAYDRQRLKVVWTASDALPETELKILIHGTGESEVLVYVDSARITPSTPKEEYIGRMNVGIEESRLPTSYVNDVIRPYIPAPGKYAVGTRKGVHHSHKVSAAREK